MGSVLTAWGGALGDLFGKPLRGLVVLCALLAALLLGVLVWTGLTFLMPMLPAPSNWPSWLGGIEHFLAGAAVIVLAALLFAPVSMIVGGALLDLGAERVEKIRFPNDAPGKQPAPLTGLAAGLKLAPAALGLNLLALPLMFIPLVNVAAFTLLGAFLMGREYFTLAALRHGDLARAQTLRKKHGAAIYAAALLPSLLVNGISILPIAPFLLPFVAVVGLPAPLLGAAIMVRLHRSISAGA